MNIAQTNMLKQQIRACQVLDDQVLDVISNTSRHEFVPQSFSSLAYADMSLPLPYGQEMLSPRIEALMLQALKIKKTDVVLEIGTGTGYITALLAKLSAHVYSIDIFESFITTAKNLLDKNFLNNITFLIGDAARGWREYAPYNVIVITGSLPTLPEEFAAQLQDNGRLFSILGDSPVMSATLFSLESNHFKSDILFEMNTLPLIQPHPKEMFLF